MKIKFTKMHGCGNDYIYVDCLKCNVESPECICPFISDRHYGIGSDGLILILPSKVADFRMQMFNADGSEGSMCGNGIRCVAKYVYDNKLTSKNIIDIETKSGIKHIKLFEYEGNVKTVEVDMGFASLSTDKIMITNDSEFVDREIEAVGKKFKGTAVWVGNPHLVIFEDNIKDIDLNIVGPYIEKNPIFPYGVNVEFVRVIDSKTLEMRVWERGSGETLACGTGACASVVAAVRLGYCNYDDIVTVRLLGGELCITYKRDKNILMKGPANTVFEGEINID